MTWNPNCVLSNLDENYTFATTDAKRYVTIITSSTEECKIIKTIKSRIFSPVYWKAYNVTMWLQKNQLILVVKESTDCLLLLVRLVLIELQSILTKDTFFQEHKLKSTALKLM